MDGSTATSCTANAYTAPARKRRNAEPEGTMGLDGPQVSVEEVNEVECTKKDSTGTVCLEVAKKSSSSATSTCAATSLMALLTGTLLR